MEVKFLRQISGYDSSAIFSFSLFRECRFWYFITSCFKHISMKKLILSRPFYQDSFIKAFRIICSIKSHFLLLAVNKNRRRQPAHPYRLKLVDKKPIMKTGPKTYQVVLLEEGENKSESYSYSDEIILRTWFIDLFLDEKEESIKMKLADVLQSKLSLISSNFFEFVKSFMRTISAPTVWNNFRWDFVNIKSLAEQRKLYVRLILPSHVVTKNVSDEESSFKT